MVISAPRWHRAEAASRPTRPEPTMNTRLPLPKASSIFSASLRSRKPKTLGASRKWGMGGMKNPDPVAMSSLS